MPAQRQITNDTSLTAAAKDQTYRSDYTTPTSIPGYPTAAAHVREAEPRSNELPQELQDIVPSCAQQCLPLVDTPSASLASFVYSLRVPRYRNRSKWKFTGFYASLNDANFEALITNDIKFIHIKYSDDKYCGTGYIHGDSYFFANEFHCYISINLCSSRNNFKQLSFNNSYLS
ncbi:hypothetical protein KC332_g15069 [Hortaea werneckii]|nr:hypothetical protein KC332_g15069 [Hortaea werneckii]